MVGALLATLTYFRGALRAGRVPTLAARVLDAERPTEWPSVCVVVAASNEAEAIPDALSSWLALDYPGLRWVLVDDRSTDGTAARAQAIGEDERGLSILRVEALPPGWLGKVHALNMGMSVVDADLVLFTDADVRIARTALRRAVAVMAAEGLDHLTLIPTHEAPSWWVAVAQQAGVSMLLAASRTPTQTQDDGKSCLGIGAFNLVRRSRLEQAGGLERLRLEVLDDMGVARSILDAGGRSRAYRADGEVALQQYDSLGAMARGMSKVFWGGASFSRLRLLLQALGLAVLAVGPTAALFVPSGWPFGALAWAALLALALRKAARRDQGFLMTATLPLGQLLIAAMMGRALVVDGPRGHLDWRGTRYPFGALRAGRVVRVPAAARVPATRVSLPR